MSLLKAKYLYCTKLGSNKIHIRHIRKVKSSAPKCPHCEYSLDGKVVKWRKNMPGYIELEITVKCNNCGKANSVKDYIYDCKKGKL